MAKTLKQRLYQESNTMYYDEATEKTIKVVFLINDVHHETVEILHDTVSEALKHNERIIEALQNALSVMQQQLTSCQQELEKRDH